MREKHKEKILKVVSYTPFSQKTGIMYKFWIAILFEATWATALVFQMLHGLLYDNAYHLQYFYGNLMQFFLWPIMYLLFNWMYRSTVLYTNELFFADEKFRKLFLDEDSFNQYKTKFYKSIHSPKEYIIIIPFLLSQIIGFTRAFNEPTFLSVIYVVGQVMESIAFYIAVVSLGSIAYYVIMVFYRFFIFVGNEKLSLKKYLDWFKNVINNSTIEDPKNLQVTLYSFQNNTRVIGKYLFIFFFKFIILLVCADFVVYIPSFFLPIDTGAAIYWVPGTMVLVALFVLAQVRIHTILKFAKEKVIDGLNDFYNKFKLQLYHMFYERNWEEKKGLMDQVSFIQDELEEISKMGTWTYDFPAILKMIGAALITIIPLILEYVPLPT
jgi:hypothetical protein